MPNAVPILIIVDVTEIFLRTEIAGERRSAIYDRSRRYIVKTGVGIIITRATIAGSKHHCCSIGRNERDLKVRIPGVVHIDTNGFQSEISSIDGGTIEAGDA